MPPPQPPLLPMQNAAAALPLPPLPLPPLPVLASLLPRLWRAEGQMAQPVHEPTVCQRFASVRPQATRRFRKAATSAGDRGGEGGGGGKQAGNLTTIADRLQ